MSDITEIISSLPEPKIFADVKIEDIVSQNVAIAKEIQPDITLIESDSNMLQIEAFSYKELFLRNMFNVAIKTMLPHYCEGDDLDNFIFGFYGGEKRLEGVEPSAPYLFELEEPLNVDINIPKGLQLSDGLGSTSYLNEDITLAAGELSVVGSVKLDEKTQTSDTKTEIVISPFPYVITVLAQENFAGGTDLEDDESFLQRAILGLYQYSTAGGKKAYEYFAKSADSRVYDVKILNPQARHIDVIVLASSDEEEVRSTLEITLNDEKVQAFDDVVTVITARKKEVIRDVTIYLFDLANQTQINSNILDSFNTKFKINETLPFSNLISKMHIGGVYKVLLDDKEDVEVEEDEYINLTLNITYESTSL